MKDKERYRQLDLKKEQLEIQLKQTKSKAKKQKLNKELKELMPKWLEAFKKHHGVNTKQFTAYKMEGKTRS